MQETRDLRCHTAMLEDQLQDSKQQGQKMEQEKEKSDHDLRQWYQKFVESDKENNSLQIANLEHRRDIWDLENQLRQEQNVAHIVSPGEYMRLMKEHEKDSLANDYSMLKRALATSQCDRDLCLMKLTEQEKVIDDLRKA